MNEIPPELVGTMVALGTDRSPLVVAPEFLRARVYSSLKAIEGALKDPDTTDRALKTVAQNLGDIVKRDLEGAWSGSVAASPEEWASVMAMFFQERLTQMVDEDCLPREFGPPDMETLPEPEESTPPTKKGDDEDGGALVGAGAP